MANFQHPEFCVKDWAKFAAKRGMTKDAGHDRYETTTKIFTPAKPVIKRRRRLSGKPAADSVSEIEEENAGVIDDGQDVPSNLTAAPSGSTSSRPLPQHATQH
ncbi:hypothetical protein PG997_009963 [Apiospora hydei]|uniref:Uncharacterized protein n=1 Tax=Apiospora hydei TaxID=1337664 RepID=A0ABR1VVM3_9PEZI